LIRSLHHPAGQDTPTGRARHAREAAAYINSYLSTGKGSKRRLGESVRSDQLPRSVIHVSTRLTMQTGVRMRALRFRRLAHCRWGVELPFPEQRLVQDLVAAFPGCELERGPPTGEFCCQRCAESRLVSLLSVGIWIASSAPIYEPLDRRAGRRKPRSNRLRERSDEYHHEHGNGN
jgi:hypothetical protein